jgi:hypothetical protein
MRKKVSDPAEPKSLRTFVIFCVVVLFLILGSFAFRIVEMLQESTFDSQQRYTFLITPLGKTAEVYSFDPTAKIFVKVSITSNKFSGSLGKTLGIPIDSTVTPKSNGQSGKAVTDVLLRIAFMPFRFHTEMTPADALRLYYLAKQSEQADSLQVTLPRDEGNVQELLGRAFYDSSVVNENMTVEIINASGVAGLAVRLERLLATSGFNVIAVNGATKSIERSQISTSAIQSQSIKRLKKVLSYEVKETKQQSIADITVVIGEDSREQQKF